MIKLSSKQVLIQQSDGSRIPVDLDILRSDLEKSLAVAGVAEHWVADHVVAMVEMLVEESPVIADGRGGIDRKVARILLDAGFPDVAASFAECRGVAGQPRAAKGRLPYHHARILAIVTAGFSLSPRGAGMLTDDVLRRLDALGFAEVSDSLILEVARHELDVRAKAHRSPGPSAGGGGWLMPPGYWEACFSGEVAQFIRQGVLVIYPVSQLFPVARASFSLVSLIKTLAEPPAELDDFLPRLGAACQLAADAVYRLREEAMALSGATGQHPGHLVVKDLEAVLADAFGGRSRAKRKACRARLEATIRDALRAYPATHLVLSIESK